MWTLKASQKDQTKCQQIRIKRGGQSKSKSECLAKAKILIKIFSISISVNKFWYKPKKSLSKGMDISKWILKILNECQISGGLWHFLPDFHKHRLHWRCRPTSYEGNLGKFIYEKVSKQVSMKVLVILKVHSNKWKTIFVYPLLFIGLFI